MSTLAFALGALRWVGFALGLTLAVATWRSIIITIVQPRSVTSHITWLTWRTVNRIFLFVARRLSDYTQKDALLSLLAPIALMTMLVVWLACFLLSFALIFWPLIPGGSLGDALDLSGASLFTLGTAFSLHGAPIAVEFIAASTGMIVVALQIGYLPAIYGAYNRREALVTALSIRAGAPSWGPEILARHGDPKSRATLAPLYAAWEGWSADIVESHASYPWLIVFRSPEPLHSWVIGLLAVLDSAALYLALAPDEAPAEALQCLQAGIIAFQHVSVVTQDAGYSGKRARAALAWQGAKPGASPTLPYERFTYGVEHVHSAGFPVTRSSEDAWMVFSSWRSQYETLAYAMADFVVATPAPWSGKRSHMTRQEAFEIFANRTQPPTPAAPVEMPVESETTSEAAEAPLRAE